MHDHVRVKDDEAREDDCSSKGDDKVERIRTNEELEMEK